eukprot:TRINITY_DN50264_c0_g1_i1.p1 TRINITY_DN50264_c0_g1~~TRINITY_DN50264_c0_g1_i1.p1  ORF type:complete len:304 (-),score=30.01 TRINITY_DN50264_c0_g1_i1:57-926(-)
MVNVLRIALLVLLCNDETRCLARRTIPIGMEWWSRVRFIHAGTGKHMLNLFDSPLESQQSGCTMLKLGVGFYTTAYMVAEGEEDRWTVAQDNQSWGKYIWNNWRPSVLKLKFPFQLVFRSTRQVVPRIAMVGCDFWYNSTGTLTQKHKQECYDSHDGLAAGALSVACRPGADLHPECVELVNWSSSLAGCATLTRAQLRHAIEHNCLSEIKWNLRGREAKFSARTDLSLQMVGVANYAHGDSAEERENIQADEDEVKSVSGIKRFVQSAYKRHPTLLQWLAASISAWCS